MCKSAWEIHRRVLGERVDEDVKPLSIIFEKLGKLVKYTLDGKRANIAPIFKKREKITWETMSLLSHISAWQGNKADLPVNYAEANGKQRSYNIGGEGKSD